MHKKPIIKVEDDHFIIQVKVQPKGSKNAWGATQNDEWILLKITAPPVEGAANKLCIKWIANQFKTAKSKVTLLAGEKSRHKTFLVQDYDAQELQKFIQTHLSKQEN